MPYRVITLMAVCLAAMTLGAGPALARSDVMSKKEAATKLKQLHKKAHKAQSVINFWHNDKHRWTLYLNHQDKPCWKVPLVGPERLCLTAREQVRRYTRKLKKAQTRIDRLTRPPELITGSVGNLNAWMCIHRYEGSWTDPNPPYYGGLQMDMDFMRDYGPMLLRIKGTADNWTPKEQIIVAQRAYSSGRGYYPWPNTARACGLL